MCQQAQQHRVQKHKVQTNQGQPQKGFFNKFRLRYARIQALGQSSPARTLTLSRTPSDFPHPLARHQFYITSSFARILLLLALASAFTLLLFLFGLLLCNNNPAVVVVRTPAYFHRHRARRHFLAGNGAAAAAAASGLFQRALGHGDDSLAVPEGKERVAHPPQLPERELVVVHLHVSRHRLVGVRWWRGRGGSRAGDREEARARGEKGDRGRGAPTVIYCLEVVWPLKHAPLSS